MTERVWNVGYTTDFEGQFNLDRPLDDETFALLKGLSQTRRMKRDLGPEYGVEGEFFVEGDWGNVGRPETILDSNTPPRTQPGLWCQWMPTDDRKSLEWDEGEKCYRFTEWLTYIVNQILIPRHYVLNGSVTWQGEDSWDMGRIVVKDNVVTEQQARITYEEAR
jgi:hypothetical protein